MHTILKKLTRFLVLGLLFFLPKEKKIRIDRWLRGKEEYRKLRLADGVIVSFEIPQWQADFIKQEAIPQYKYKTNPQNQGGMAPKIVDPGKPGYSVELPQPWVDWVREYAVQGTGNIAR